MVLSDTSRGDIGWKKWLVATWAIVECLLFGGLIFGWASLVWVYKDKDVYADLCPDDSGPFGVTDTSVTTTPAAGVTLNITSTSAWANNDDDDKCDAQDARITLCFTVSSTVFSVSGAVLGYINYRFATRATRLIYFWFFVGGALILGFVSKDVPWLMFPGLILIGIGGLPVLVTNTQVSTLFKKGSSTLVGLLCGAFDMSAAVMLIVKLAYESGFAPRNTFIIIAAVYTGMTAVSTFVFLPKGFIQSPDKSSDYQAPDDVKTAMNDEDEGPPAKTDSPDLKRCLKNPMFITHIIWMCLLQLRLFYFLGTVNTFLNRKLDDDDDLVSEFTNVLMYTMMGGLVGSFIAGLVHDWQKRYVARRQPRSRLYQSVMPAVLPLSFTCGLSVLLSVLVLFDERNLLYVIFVTMTLCKSFLYSIAVAFLTDLFPIACFGILYGTMFICGGLIGLLQYAFFTWTEAYDGAPLHADIFLLCLILVSFGHPLYLWRRCRLANDSI